MPLFDKASSLRLAMVGVMSLIAWSCVGPQVVAPIEVPYTVADYARVPKFDAHVHANTADRALVDQARADGFELLSINVDYPDFPPVAEQNAIARSLSAASPHFHYAGTFTLEDFDTPDFATKVSARIRKTVREGAVAVKVWKNVGMALRDRSGKLVMIDDPRFLPVWAQVQTLGVPLIGHQGEPYNCWLPLEEMTTENDRAYFAAHPQYHMYLHPEMPSYEEQMAARDRMLKNSPGIRFVGAHVASLEWSVDRLGSFLDANPGATVDLAARMAQIQVQSERDYQKVRTFFIRYQDRILYGSDLTHAPGADAAEFKQSARNQWLSDWRYLATADSQPIPNIKATVRGLALPRAVVDKIYSINARRVFRAGNRQV